MIPLITPADMRQMEQRFFRETGVASIELMEVAARALCDAILARYGAERTVYIACGPGGNGGDGYACARMLRQAGGRAAIVSAREPNSPDAAENLRRALEAGVPEAPADRPDVWVDALYGTGLSRAPAGPAADLIRRINADRAQGSAVVAVDIPSGLNGLTGSGYILGGRCEMIDEENPLTNLMAGIVKLHVYITPPSPAQEIDFVIEYDSAYVTDALS